MLILKVHFLKSLLCIDQYAIGTMSGGKYLGAQAYLNVWKPEVVDDEFSLAQIWVTAGPHEEVNTVEAGWMVRTKND